MLYNGLGRYEDGLAAAERAAEHPLDLGLATWVLPELIEAAGRSGNAERATNSLVQLTEIAGVPVTHDGLARRSRRALARS